MLHACVSLDNIFLSDFCVFWRFFRAVYTESMTDVVKFPIILVAGV